MTSRQMIIITGYPRSGNTWLGRLLADVLGCEYNSQDGEAGDWPGDRTDAPYLIRKSHALTTPDAAHTVYIYRDPRDVAVSVMFYRQFHNLFEAMDGMQRGIELFGSGAYSRFSATWYGTRKAAIEVGYHELHAAPVDALRGIVETVTPLAFPVEVYHRAIGRQSLVKAQLRYHDTHHIRKGIVGDWRNHFTRAAGRVMQELFGDLMMRQGFIESADWWQELPEQK